MAKILAVDDNNDNLIVLKALLSDSFPDLQLFLTSTGKEALEICIREKPDVILLDIIMPGMDGYQVCTEIKKIETLAHIPIVMITAALNDKASRIRALEFGADGFLTKPIDESELTAQVKAMLRIKESEDKKLYEKEQLENLIQIRTQALEKELSDRKQTEEELRKKQDALLYEQYLLSSLMDNSPDYIYFKDIQSRFIRINKAWASQNGIENTLDAIDKTDFDFFTNEHASQAYKDEQEIIKTGIPIINKEEKETRSNNIETWVSTTKMPLKSKEGVIIGTFGISRDITELKVTENKIKLLSRALEQSPVSIIIADRDGNIEYTNPKFTEVSGYTAEEVIGKNPRILRSTIYPKEYYQDLWNTVLSGQDWHGEFLNKKKNQEFFWESAIICPILDDQKNIISLIAIKEDITQKKQMLTDLIVAKDKAEENDHLKTAFLHNISHEIRTPMNAIIGFSEFLSNDALPVEKRNQIIDIIKQNCNQLLSIITDIVDIATIEAGQEKVVEEIVNLNSIIQVVYNQFIPKTHNQKISLEYDASLPDGEDQIITDDTKLIQILNNIIGNAFKFTQEGFIKFGYTIKNQSLEFYVEDSGIGIPPDMFEEIFKRFRQIEYSHTRKFGGSGLGLSISKAYIEIMGGKIWLKSEVGQGSTFYFTLPYHKATKELGSSDDLKKDLNIIFDNTVNMLVAEDEDFNFLLLTEILLDQNITITRAENGLDAVEIFTNNPSFDLILMDLKMPIMDGIEATKKIRETNTQIPIIALTAYTLNSDKEIAINSGCNDFISKPYKQALLLSKIKEYLEKK